MEDDLFAVFDDGGEEGRGAPAEGEGGKVGDVHIFLCVVCLVYT